MLPRTGRRMRFVALAAAAFGACLTGAFAAEPPMQFQTWTDPTERAFTVQVPKGWKAEGGINRRYLRLLCESVTATSPDGGVMAVIGNDFPLFTELNELLRMSGRGEWDTIPPSPPERTPQVILNYQPGEEFAARTILPYHKKQAKWDDFTIVRKSGRPDVARLLAGEAQGILSAGEVEFTFRRKETKGTGVILCITEDARPALWRVWRIFAYEAVEGREKEGQYALARMAATLRMDPGWSYRLAVLRARQAMIDAPAQEEVFRIITGSYWSRQGVMAKVFKTGSDVSRGWVDLLDPLTGEYYLGQDNKSRYYWIDARGRRVGTDTHDPPGPEFRQMQVLP